MCDEDDQADEIFAIKSIYDASEFVCDTSSRPYAGKAVIYLQTNSGPYEVVCQDDFVTLKHLPPIILLFSLPSNYPSGNPPTVELTCNWMTSRQIEMLTNRLREQWLENCKNVILFTWISFLQVEVLEYLSIKFPLTVTQEKMRMLTDYSLQWEEETFNKAFHECPICFCMKPGTECLKLGKCGHLFCKECLSGFLSVHIADGNVYSLQCLVDKCDSQLYPNVIKDLVSQSEFERYDRLLLQNTLDIMNDVIYCPRTQCCNPVVIEKGEGFGVCQACNFVFCVSCKLTYHGIEKCKDQSEISPELFDDLEEEEEEVVMPSHEDLLKLRDDYQSGDIEKRKSLEQAYGRKKILKMKDYFKSEKWLTMNAKMCPQCSSYFIKISGCDRVRCLKCGANFCCKCLQRYHNVPTCPIFK